MWNSEQDRIEFGLIHSSRRSKEAGERIDFGDYEIERGVQDRLLDELLVAKPSLRFTPEPAPEVIDDGD